MSRKPHPAKHAAGFTLTEVMVTMLLISMMCLSVFVGLQQITKAMLSVAVRSEAHRVLQAEAERLLATDYTSFTASPATEVTCSVKTTYSPNRNVAALALTPDNGAGRIKFTREVVLVESTDTSKTLRVDVKWTWQGAQKVVSTPLFRTR